MKFVRTEYHHQLVLTDILTFLFSNNMIFHTGELKRNQNPRETTFLI